jgi:hypothetical protein
VPSLSLNAKLDLFVAFLGVLDVRFSSVVDACPSIPELMLEVFLDVSLESHGSGDVVEVSFFSAVAVSLDSLLAESGQWLSFIYFLPSRID